MTRLAILVQSALTGLVMGLVGGALLLGALAIALAVIPGIPPRLVERARTPVVLLCLVGLPALLAVLGWLEGRGKLD